MDAESEAESLFVAHFPTAQDEVSYQIRLALLREEMVVQRKTGWRAHWQ